MGPSLGQRTIMLNKQLFLKTSVLYETTDSTKPNTVVYLYEVQESTSRGGDFGKTVAGYEGFYCM